MFQRYTKNSWSLRLRRKKNGQKKIGLHKFKWDNSRVLVLQMWMWWLYGELARPVFSSSSCSIHKQTIKSIDWLHKWWMIPSNKRNAASTTLYGKKNALKLFVVDRKFGWPNFRLLSNSALGCHSKTTTQFFGTMNYCKTVRTVYVVNYSSLVPLNRTVPSPMCMYEPLVLIAFGVLYENFELN